MMDAEMLSPYYKDQNVTIYHADCLDILPQPCDLLLTDPPYGTGKSLGRTDRLGPMIGNDANDSMDKHWALAFKGLRRGRHFYIFGPFQAGGLPVCGIAELIWDKVNFGLGNLGTPWGQQHEKIAFGVHEISASNRAKGYGKLTARLRRGSILRSLRPHSVRVNRHPTEKPVDILRQIIESSSCLGETVLDPFCGSGSTCVAAIMEGRKASGIEIEERYCEIAANRCKAATKNYAVLCDGA